MDDYDGNGLPDIFVTNFSHDSNTLYRNLGANTFVDVSFVAGLDQSSIPYLGWGTFFFDFDNDGDLDLFVANGHVYPQVDTWPSGSTYAQSKQLYENVGGKLLEVTAQAGVGLLKRDKSRGAAYLDYDNDGRLDIVVNNLGGQPTLLHNELTNENHYLLLHLKTRGRDAIGTRVALRVGERWQYREVRAGSSYLSQSDVRLHFGLGTASDIDELKINWSSSRTTVLRSVPVDQILTVEEDTNEKERSSPLPTPGR